MWLLQAGLFPGNVQVIDILYGDYLGEMEDIRIQTWHKGPTVDGKRPNGPWNLSMLKVQSWFKVRVLAGSFCSLEKGPLPLQYCESTWLLQAGLAPGNIQEIDILYGDCLGEMEDINIQTWHKGPSYNVDVKKPNGPWNLSMLRVQRLELLRSHSTFFLK